MLELLEITEFRGIGNLKIKFGMNAYITGRNGTGKTSVYDALCWCLYGKDSLGRSNFSVQRRGSAGDTVVKVVLNGNEFVRRMRNFKTICVAEGKRLSVRDYEFYIRNNLGDYSSWRRFTDTNYFFGLPVQNRREEILSLIGNFSSPELASIDAECPESELVSVLKSRLKLAKSEIASTDQRINKMENELLSIEPPSDVIGSLNTRMSELKSVKSEKMALVSKAEQVANKRKELTRKIKDIEGEIAKKNEAILKAYEEEHRNAMADYESALAEQRATRDAVNKRNDDARKKYLHEVSQIELNISSAEKDMANLKNNLEFLYRRAKELVPPSDNCSTCGQKLPPELADDINRKYSDNKLKIESEINSIGCDSDRKRKEITYLKFRLDEIKPPDKEIISYIDPSPLEIDRPILITANCDERWVSLTKELDSLPDIDVSEIYETEGEMDRVRAEIDAYNAKAAKVDYIKEQINQATTGRKTAQEDVAELEAKLQEVVAARLAANEYIERKASELLRMDVKLFRPLKNGDIAECCDVYLHDTKYDDLSAGEKVLAGLYIIGAMRKKYKIEYPMFIDNAEGYTGPLPECQTIRLVADANVANLTVRI